MEKASYLHQGAMSPHAIGIQDSHDWILNSSQWIPNSRYWIPDFGKWNSNAVFISLIAFPELCSGFQKAHDAEFYKQKISRIPESGFPLHGAKKDRCAEITIIHRSGGG